MDELESPVVKAGHISDHQLQLQTVELMQLLVDLMHQLWLHTLLHVLGCLVKGLVPPSS